MGLNCLYMINWLLSTFCLFVWRCLANLKKLGCNSARSTLGIPSGCCRSSRLPDIMPFSQGGQGSDQWVSACLFFCWSCLSGVSPKTERNVHSAQAESMDRGLESKDQVMEWRGDNSSDAKPHAQHAGGAGLSEQQDWGPS